MININNNKIISSYIHRYFINIINLYMLCSYIEKAFLIIDNQHFMYNLFIIFLFYIYVPKEIYQCNSQQA